MGCAGSGAVAVDGAGGDVEHVVGDQGPWSSKQHGAWGAEREPHGVAWGTEFASEWGGESEDSPWSPSGSSERSPWSPKRHGPVAWGVAFPSERSGETEECASEVEPPRYLLIIRIEKGAGGAIGASLGSVPMGAVLFSIQEGGVLDRWNKENPDEALRPGFIIEEVNGVSGYWRMMESLRKSGSLVLKIATVPPKSAGPSWFEDIAAISRSVGRSDAGSALMLRLPQQDPTSPPDGKEFTSLPNVVASTVGVDQCAICLEDVGPEEVLTQLPCHHGHAFHSLCTARWLSECSSQCVSKRNSCPLCCRQMVHTQKGVVAVEAQGLFGLLP